MARRARRRPYRRRSIRAAWLEAILQRWPELEVELTELRHHHAQGYRKRLLLLAQELGLAPRQPEREYPYEPSPSTRPAPNAPNASVPAHVLPEPLPEPMVATALEPAPKKRKRK